MPTEHRTQWRKATKCIFLCLAACILIHACSAGAILQTPHTWSLKEFGVIWTQHLGDASIVLDDFTEVQTVAPGEALVLSCTLPEFYDEKTFFFYTKDVETAVYLDDVLVYEFVASDAFSFLQTPGNAWHTVALSPQASGQTLRLVLTSQFENRYESTLDALYFICPSETATVLLSREGFRIIMSVVLFGSALLAYINTFLWNRKIFKRFFFALGNLYLSTTLWLFGMYGYFDYFLHRPVVSYLLSMLAASLVPVAVYEFLKVLLPRPKRLFGWVGLLVWGSFALQLVLQFIFHVSMLTLLPLTAFVYAAGSAYCIALLVWAHLPGQRAKCIDQNPLHFAISSVFIIFLGALLEIFVMVTLPARTDLLGVSSVSGLIVYLIINQFAITRMESNIDLEKIMIEENYNKLQNTSLIQQIKAHFFFNTLNNISALCKSDPAEADHAINLFARYMRSYMHLIDKQENIPLSQELSLVEASLGIEKLRFGDCFSYQLQLEYTDLLVPPLCIQPLIENACCHGLRSRQAGGMLCIRSKHIGDAVVITVQDNGAGFDTKLLDERSNSIGLKNLAKRVRLMANGQMRIESIVGEGTTVTLTFPVA